MVAQFSPRLISCVICERSWMKVWILKQELRNCEWARSVSAMKISTRMIMELSRHNSLYLITALFHINFLSFRLTKCRRWISYLLQLFLCIFDDNRSFQLSIDQHEEIVRCPKKKLVMEYYYCRYNDVIILSRQMSITDFNKTLLVISL